MNKELHSIDPIAIIRSDYAHSISEIAISEMFSPQEFKNRVVSHPIRYWSEYGCRGCYIVSDSSFRFTRRILFLILTFLLHRGHVMVIDGASSYRVRIRTLLFWSSVFFVDSIGLIHLFTKTKIELSALRKFFAATPVTTKKVRPTRSNILYVRPDLWFRPRMGGSVTHTAGVINGLLREGFGVFYLSVAPYPTVNNGAQYVPFPAPVRFYDFPELPLVWKNGLISKTGKALRSRPAFIYQRHTLNNYAGNLLSMHYRVPLITEYNGSEVWVLDNWGSGLKFGKIARAIEQTCLSTSDLIVTVSKPLVAELEGRGIEPDRILLNPNGVDENGFTPELVGDHIREQLGIPTKTTVVGFVGTFGPWHGAEVLAEALKRVFRETDDVVALFVGDGARRKPTEAILSDFSDRVYFVGAVPQMQAPEYLAACDILVAPHVPNEDGTPFFGSPTKLFEYMAMGKGIVASDLDQIGEVLGHERTALLTSPGSPPDLTEAILRLAGDAELRHALGRAAREDVVQNYTWTKHVEKILSRLRELDLIA